MTNSLLPSDNCNMAMAISTGLIYCEFLFGYGMHNRDYINVMHCSTLFYYFFQSTTVPTVVENLQFLYICTPVFLQHNSKSILSCMHTLFTWKICT